MLPFALVVGETQVDPLDVVFLDPRNDILGLGGHGLNVLLAMMSRSSGGVELDGRRRTLEGVLVALAGADTKRGLDGDHEYLAIANAAGLRGGRDRLDNALRHIVVDDNLKLHLGQEIDDIFSAAIKFGVTLLAPEALGLGNGDATDPDFVQRFLHLVQLERFDY